MFIHPDVFARVVRLLPSTLDLEFSEEFSGDMVRATVPGEASDDDIILFFREFCHYFQRL